MTLTLAATFQRLDTLITDYRRWWQFQSFHAIDSLWRTRAPSLHAALNELTKDELTLLVRDSGDRRQFLKPWLPIVDELESLCLLPRLQGHTRAHDRQLDHGVGRRKWGQVVAFAGLVPPAQAIVEWCSGKGHLGRVLAAGGARAVHSLEREPGLCRSGEALAARAGVNMTFHTCDVLTDSVAGLLPAESYCVALHACGGLHIRLLQQAVARNIQGVSVAPCCYYLIPETVYRPLSAAAASSRLRLAKPDLHIPLRETVTASARDSRLRSLELLWRLAFDCLQRDLRQRNTYLPLPTIPRHILRSGFGDFIQWATRRKSLPDADPATLDDYLTRGEARLAANRQMELVQQVFQRPLELWLALDRALYLQEHGYQVTLGEFCERHLTPRNIMVQASRHRG